jgi:hypothetical protein
MQQQDLVLEVRRLHGEGLAAYACAGIAVTAGSVADWEDDLFQQSARDNEMLRYNLQQELIALGRQASDLRDEADSLDAGSKDAERQGNMALFGGLLGGVGQMAGGFGGDKGADPTGANLPGRGPITKSKVQTPVSVKPSTKITKR